MYRVRGRALGAGRGPDTGTCSSPGVQDRQTRQSEAHGAGSTLRHRAGLRQSPLGLMRGPLNLRASPVQPGPGASLGGRLPREGLPAGGQRAALTGSGGNAPSGEPCPSPSLLGPLSQR